MNAKHTPGPWTVGDTAETFCGGCTVYAPLLDIDAEPGEKQVVADKLPLEDAKLIAFAPKMYALLVKYVIAGLSGAPTEHLSAYASEIISDIEKIQLSKLTAKALANIDVENRESLVSDAKAEVA